VESIKLLLNSSGKFQPELANVGDKAMSRWTADVLRDANVFLFVTVGRQSGFWDRHPTSPAKICLASVEPRGRLPCQEPYTPTVTDAEQPPTRHHHPPTARATALEADAAELAGDRQYSCVRWSGKTTNSWNSFQNLKPLWLFFSSPTALFSSMVKTFICALALGNACCERSHQTPRQKWRSN